MRHSELRNIVPGVSQRMLTLTLQQLHLDGLIIRTAYAEVPPRVECALTKLDQPISMRLGNHPEGLLLMMSFMHLHIGRGFWFRLRR